MNENLWSYLHDGVVSHVEGGPPDNVRITVTIPHLRKLWASDGQAIHVILFDCDDLYWDSYDTPEGDTTTDMSMVEVASPTILQVNSLDDRLVLNTESGDLVMSYAFAELELDTGEAIDLEELREKSEWYWSRL